MRGPAYSIEERNGRFSVYRGDVLFATFSTKVAARRFIETRDALTRAMR